MNPYKQTNTAAFLLAMCAAISFTCSPAPAQTPKTEPEKASIELLQVPDLPCGPDKTDEATGKITGLTSYTGLRVVIYSKCEGIYWVQPKALAPLTDIDKDGTFSTDVHGGEGFVAILVKESYKPEAQTEKLPKTGGDVLAISPLKKRPTSKTGAK